MEKQNLFMNGDELQNCIFNLQNWENSNSDPFGSALSSMVSSPAGAPPNGDNFVLRELIGRLGSICNNNSGEINISNSNNNSCYSTPLNSPPKLNLFGPSLPQFSGDPGFAERAARFSCFADKTFKESDLLGFPNLESGKISRVSSNHSMKIQEFGDNSRENSSASEQISNSRKRKSVSKGKAKESTLKNAANVSSEKNESNAKRSKSEENNEENKTKEDEKTENKDNQKPPEAPKDYIHVRARRGQATDAHSLAERVRREKISERMKFLQDLVPGCNKVTGKAVMLDEIINYVQSLQRQVEFLSMKLATVNPRMDFNMEALLSKDMFQSRGSLAHNMYQPENSGQAFPYGFQSQAINHLNPNLGRNPNMQLPSLDGYVEPTPQVPTFFEDELHSVVQMGFGQNQDHNYPGNMTNSQMKLEL